MSQNRSSQGHLYKSNAKYENSQYLSNNHSNRSERDEHTSLSKRSNRRSIQHQQKNEPYNNKYSSSNYNTNYHRNNSYNNKKKSSRSRSRGHYKRESRNRGEKYNESYRSRRKSSSYNSRNQRTSHNSNNNKNNNNNYSGFSRYQGNKQRFSEFDMGNNLNHVSRDTREFKYGQITERKSNSRDRKSLSKSSNHNYNNSNNNNGKYYNRGVRSRSNQYSKGQNQRKKRQSSSSERSLSSHYKNNNNSYNYSKSRNDEYMGKIIDPQRAKKLVEENRRHFEYKQPNRYLENKYTHKQYSPVSSGRGNYGNNKYRDRDRDRNYRERNYSHREHNSHRGGYHGGSNYKDRDYYQGSRERDRDRRVKYDGYYNNNNNNNNYHNNNNGRYYESNSHRHRAGYRCSSHRSDNKPRSIYINNNRFENYNNSKYDKYNQKQQNSSNNNNYNNNGDYSGKNQKEYQSSQSEKSRQNQSSGSKSEQSSSSSSSSGGGGSSNKKDRSKDAGHYKYKIGEIIEGNYTQYELIRRISDGTFGRVFEVRNLKSKKIEAMKVIRAVERYIDSAKTEIAIIQKLQKWDPEDKNKIVRLYDTFSMDKTKNYGIVFEKLGPSLFDMIQKNKYKGFPIFRVQSFFKQILEAIGFIHSKQLTHTDLKPENILLRYDRIEKIDGMWMPAKDTNNEIKIIDFGGATFANEHHSSIINTRQYRAPEVILECGKWWEISDIWSIGCIICELITGDLLFQTHESYEHMSMVEKNSGETPQWMVKQSKLKNEWFYWNDQQKKYCFNWPEKSSSRSSRQRVQEIKTITDLFSSWPQLLDLLKKCLTIDPHQRITCAEALKHPFFEQNFQ